MQSNPRSRHWRVSRWCRGQEERKLSDSHYRAAKEAKRAKLAQATQEQQPSKQKKPSLWKVFAPLVSGKR